MLSNRESFDFDHLAEHGWVVNHTLFSNEDCRALKSDAIDHQAQFKAAKISKNHTLLTDYRSDRTLWLSDENPIQSQYLNRCEILKNALNQDFYLGLKSYEAHYALYQPGSFYKTHIDNFKHQGPRRITTVLFLNENWLATDGGELVIYHPDSEKVLQKIAPQISTLVVFKSEVFPHEVLAPNRDRWSIAGWFRID